MLALLLACTRAPEPVDSPVDTAPVVDSEAPSPPPERIRVLVTLDGQPIEGVSVGQCGTDLRLETDALGEVEVPLDHTLDEVTVFAHHPDARLAGATLRQSALDAGEVEIALLRFDRSDNPEYRFEPPGSPEDNESTAVCAHCHVTINADWDRSRHRDAASNPRLHDLFAGAAAAWSDVATCDAAGGTWASGLGPGTGEEAERCYLGSGVLQDLNPDCGVACDDRASETGACADCHAPGIDGQLGGRSLLEATDVAYDDGVHCSVCHLVEDVDLDDTAPGVAGRLHILRPAEVDDGPVGTGWSPLTFGPYDDVLNPRMGAVPRDHYASGEICAGCHEYTQEVLVPDAEIDRTRWPDGRLPVHSTWSEVMDGPLAVPCQSCHMPPDPDVGNAADLGNQFAIPEGVAGGFYRHPGAVRRHVWYGPGHPEQRMLDLAAGLQVDSAVSEGRLQVDVRVSNVGPGHAIPTGEPLRSLIVVVDARCGGERLSPVDGLLVPDFGGALETRDGTRDWTLWPDAQAGQRLRVVSVSDQWVDYTGYGPFGDGTFSAAGKGMPVEVFEGEVGILAVAEDGTLTLDGALPEGDRVYRVPAYESLPEEGDPWGGWAGLPGWGYARVMADAEGARMVPHHAAVDVVSDNRILPSESFTSSHGFAATCEAPEVQVVLLYRAYPLDLALERGWPTDEVVMGAQR